MEVDGNPTAAGPRGWRAFVRAALFLVLAGILVAVLSALFTPTFNADSRYSVQGIYSQPRNTVEVATFGTSTLRKGLSPNYLYEKFGIVAYDSCSNSQPVISSYYLLEDMLTMQGDSLKVVLVDAGPMVGKDKNVGVERVTGTMRPSLSKLGHIWSSVLEYPKLKLSEQLVGVLRYHSRWAELAPSDFEPSLADSVQESFHGQNIYESIFRSNATLGEAGAKTGQKNSQITDEQEAQDAELQDKWNARSVKYMDKIVELCAARGIAPVLVKVADDDWGDVQHDSVALFARQRGIDFIDLAVPKVWDEVGLAYDTDYSDSRHVNVGGSVKVTDYLGKYLKDRFELSDVRDDADSPFTEEELALFAEMVEDDALKSCDELGGYLDALCRERYTVFVAVRGEAADGLGEEARAKLAEMGLAGLAGLDTNESYAAVLDGGTCIAQSVGESGDEAVVYGTFRDGRAAVGDGVDAGSEGSFSISSVGSPEGAKAAIIVNGKDFAENERGINFVVYDRLTGIRIDDSSFDTHEGAMRTSDVAEVAG